MDRTGEIISITKEADAKILEGLIIGGDLSRLTPAQRVQYYAKVCESLGLNPLTKPFDYVNLQGKLTLYARKDATDQLRKIHNVSIKIVSRERIEGDLYLVTAQARLPDGREDESTGAVVLSGLKGADLANTLMKCETKAKRRVTLSIIGLGWLDECEVESISDAPRGEHLSTQPPQEQAPPAPPLPEPEPEIKVNESQVKTLFLLAKKNGTAPDILLNTMRERYNLEASKDLSVKQYQELCTLIHKQKGETAKTHDLNARLSRALQKGT